MREIKKGFILEDNEIDVLCELIDYCYEHRSCEDCPMRNACKPFNEKTKLSTIIEDIVCESSEA